MIDKTINKISIFFVIFMFIAITAAGSACAFWGQQKTESKLDKDAYETLVKKNLDLRNEVDRLIKEQEQLRSIYKILLEKVKTLQRDNEELSERLKSAVQNKVAARGAVAEPYSEPEPGAQDGRARGLQEGIMANKEIVEDQARMIREQEERIEALEDEMAKLKGVFDASALKKNYPEAFAGKEEAAVFLASQPVKRANGEIEKLSAGQKAKKERLSALDGEVESAAAKQDEVKKKIESSAKRIADLRQTLADSGTEIKTGSEKSSSEQDRIKTLEGYFDKAVSEQRDYEVRLEDAKRKIDQIKGSIKNASSAPAPKGSPADFKSDEMKSLEKELEKASDIEKDLKEKAEEAEMKVDDLRSAMNEARARSEQETAKVESAKKAIGQLERDVAKGEAEEKALKKELQHLTKMTDDLKQKRDLLAADIAAQDAKISDLKKIIEKEIREIDKAYSPDSSKGLAGEARLVLSALNDRMRELKARNEELEKSLKNAQRRGDRPLRKGELPPEVKSKLDKERLDMHYNLAVVYDKHNMYKDAEREYLKCLKIDQDDPDVIYNLGILYDDKLHDVHEAAKYYSKYLEIRPMGESATQVRVWLTNIELEQRLGRETR